MYRNKKIKSNWDNFKLGHLVSSTYKNKVAIWIMIFQINNWYSQ
jgi:hypothetical protein